MNKKYFEKEKKYIKSIKDGSDHRLFRDRWLDSKRVLDRIFKSLLRIRNEKNMKVSLDTNTLAPKEKELLSSVLLDAKKSRVLDYAEVTGQKSLPRVIDLVVFEREKFEKYRKPVRDLCSFIEDDGVDRFPLKYASTIKAREGLKVRIKIYISDKDGIFRECDGNRLVYPIKGKKRMQIIRSLESGKKPGPFLAKHISNDNLRQISGEIGNINIKFIENLELKEKMIIRFETGGYDLNHEEYEFIFQ
jgi:hypothetical protein